MPESVPAGNAPESAEAELERKRREIIKLKEEILKEEERIERIPNWLDKDIAQNILNEKRGLLEIRINEYDKLSQKIR